jgi:transposase
MPPDVRDWLPEQHLVWTVLDAVREMDLSGFYARYRSDGRSRPPYDPALMVGLLLFGYCDGVRSSRQIELRCERDVAYRVITGNHCPDHATIARFRREHRDGLAGVFTQVLRLLAAAGLVRVGLVALDGTRMRGNASCAANRTGRQLVDDIAAASGRADAADPARTADTSPGGGSDGRSDPGAGLAGQVEDILDEAEAADAAEDARFGDRRGDEPPAGMATRGGRLTRLREAKRRLDEQAQSAQQAQDQRIRDWRTARAAGQNAGRKPGRRPPKNDRSERINVTDPDSRIIKIRHGFVQGYNAQIVVGANQVIIAAGLAESSADTSALHPMLHAARAELDAAGITDRMGVCLADSGYGGKDNLSEGAEPILLIATGTGRKRSHTTPPKDQAVAAMARRVASSAGQALYRRRAPMIEPVFGQAKQRLGPYFLHRGFDMVNTEWRLIAASHNLLKYWRRQPQPATA